MKRPQTDDAPKAPAKWVLLGHSLGVMGLELVSTRLAIVASPFLRVVVDTLHVCMCVQSWQLFETYH